MGDEVEVTFQDDGGPALRRKLGENAPDLGVPCSFVLRAEVHRDDPERAVLSFTLHSKGSTLEERDRCECIEVGGEFFCNPDRYASLSGSLVSPKFFPVINIFDLL